MKKKLIVILLLWIPVQLLAPAERCLTIIQTEAINPYIPYWNAVGYVESRFDPYAINKEDPNGGSHGIVQIGQEKLDEYNTANGTHYTLQDCYDIEISRKIFMWHMMQFNDIEIAVKRWNGSGPKTLDYWELIQNRLKELKVS